MAQSAGGKDARRAKLTALGSPVEKEERGRRKNESTRLRSWMRRKHPGKEEKRAKMGEDRKGEMGRNWQRG